MVINAASERVSGEQLAFREMGDERERRSVLSLDARVGTLERSLVSATTVVRALII